MTDHLPSTITAAARTGANERVDLRVVPVVVSRRSGFPCNRRSSAIFRLWREGTDPAQRGPRGRRQVKPVRGGAA